MERLSNTLEEAPAFARNAAARMLSSTRGFTPEQSMAMREFELAYSEPIQSGHPSGELHDEDES